MSDQNSDVPQGDAASAAQQPVPPRPPLPTAGYAAQQPYVAPHGAPTAAGASGPQDTGPTQPLHPTAPPSTPTYAWAPPSDSETPATRGKVGAGRVTALIVAAALVGGAAGLGGSAVGARLFGAGSTVVQSAPSTVTVNDTGSVNQTTAIATKVIPSVVTISAQAGQEGGTGSGVVLSSDGYVVTNTHVVTLDGKAADAQLSATTSDGVVHRATLVGTDPIYDLAVIKLDGVSGLTPMEFTDSSKLNVGDPTIAVGAPLGLSNTVTTGIVSALNRSIKIASSAVPDGDQSEDQGGGNGQDGPFQFDFGQGQSSAATGTISISVIQTDAAINPGNSGGALVDDRGRLIGINVAIASAGSGSQGQSGSIGVGFSIPANIVERVADEIVKDGAATHGLLGATVFDAAAQQDATVSGAVIREVVAGGAAAAAGLQAGDVVTSIGDLPVTDSTDLTAQVRAFAAGADTQIVYVRDGQTRSASVTLGTLGS